MMGSHAENVLVINQPGRFLSFPDLIEVVNRPVVGAADEAASAVISDIGPSKMMKFAGMQFPVYSLRGKSKKLPGHEVGVIHVGDAYSYLSDTIVDVPAVGSHVIVSATQTAPQSALYRYMRNVRADAVYIIILDEPLGANHLLEITAPEYTETTSVRGIKWKPAAKPVIAVEVPWRNDVALNAWDALRPGNPGLDIKIACLEDNTITGVSVPLKMCIFRAIHNISCTMWNIFEFNGALPQGLSRQFKPAPTPTVIEEEQPIVVTLQMADNGADSPDPQASADSAPAAEAVAASTVSSEKPQPLLGKTRASRPRNPRAQTRKDQTSALSQKWVLFRTYTFTDEGLGVDVTINFDPSTLETGGESIMRPFRRNIYFTGSRALGFTTLYHFKMVSNRAPQVAGRILIESHTNALGVRWVHTLGGAPTEFTAAPTAFQGSSSRLVKNRNSPWLKCASQREASFRIKLISYNRTDAIAGMKVKLFVKPGDLVFQVPIRPRVRTTAIKQSDQLLLSIAEKKVDQSDLFTIGHLFKNLSFAEPQIIPVREQAGGGFTYNGKTYDCDFSGDKETAMDRFYDCYYDDLSEGDSAGLQQAASNYYDTLQGDPGNIANLVAGYVPAPGGSLFPGATRNPEIELEEPAPPGASAPENGEFDGGSHADVETIDQDDFWVCAGEAQVPTDGTAIAFPLDMESITDSFGNGGPSPIREKFLRYANIIPKNGGQFGPVIGSYTVIPRLPTGISANLAHVCLPDDLNEETALRIFGLGSLLGMAGSALTSIGGPLLKGAVSAIGPLFSNVVGSLFGGSQKEETPGASQEPPAQAPAIGGDIPVSRYLSLLKTLIAPENRENPAANLLLQLTDVISENTATGSGSLPKSLPMKIMVKMANLLAERELFDRPSVDLIESPDRLMLSTEQTGIVIQELSLSNDVRHREIALKLLTLVGEKLDSVESLTPEFYIDAKRILKEEIPLPSSDEVQRITSALLALVPTKP